MAAMENKMKVLIAYDGVHPIQYFINDLKKAGLPKDVDALVMTVVDAFMPPKNSSHVSRPKSAVTYIDAMLERAEARIEKQLALAAKTADKSAKSLRASFRGWTVNFEVCTNSPAWAIVKKEDEWKPDLIVVGSHEASSAARFFLGSISSGVLIHSKCSVRIVRKHQKSLKQASRIIIGVDGSLGSQAAVRVVAGRVWPKGTLVRLVAGFDQNIAFAVALHHLPGVKMLNLKDETQEDWMRQMTGPFTKTLTDAGLEVAGTIKAGKPWKVLVEEAEKWKADCVFVGARGLGMLDRFLLGSVSNAVASRSRCSVEVVRLNSERSRKRKK